MSFRKMSLSDQAYQDAVQDEVEQDADIESGKIDIPDKKDRGPLRVSFLFQVQPQDVDRFMTFFNSTRAPGMFDKRLGEWLKKGLSKEDRTEMCCMALAQPEDEAAFKLEPYYKSNPTLTLVIIVLCLVIVFLLRQEILCCFFPKDPPPAKEDPKHASFEYADHPQDEEHGGQYRTGDTGHAHGHGQGEQTLEMQTYRDSDDGGDRDDAPATDKMDEKQDQGATPGATKGEVVDKDTKVTVEAEGGADDESEHSIDPEDDELGNQM